jgi:hypothetical protein
MTATTTRPAAETNLERYARQTRTAAVFIAWVVALWLAVSVIGGIAVAVHVHEVNVQNQNGTNCLSTGGNNPNC